MIDDALTDQNLRVPPSNHFEKLQGKRDGYRLDQVDRVAQRL